MFSVTPYVKPVVNFLFFNHVEVTNTAVTCYMAMRSVIAYASGSPVFDGLTITTSSRSTIT